MALKDVGKLFRHGKAKTLFLSVPSRIVRDHRFPFEEGDEVMVSVKDKKIVVEKIEA